MAENRNSRAAALYPQTDPRRILYQGGCMRFANLDAPHYAVVWDLLVEYCIEWRCATTARLLMRASTTSRRLLLDRIDGLQPPNMGDCQTFAPAHANRQERIAWAFARCHGCLNHAIDRRTVACTNTGVGIVILTCSTCPTRCGRRLNGVSGPGWLRGGRRVLFPRGTGQVQSPSTHGSPLVRAISISADLLEACKAAKVVRVFARCPVPFDFTRVCVEMHIGQSALEHVCAADWHTWSRINGKKKMTGTLEIVEALIDVDREWRAFARVIIDWHTRVKAEAAAARRAARSAR